MSVLTSDGGQFVPGDGPKVALLDAHTRHEIDGWIARFPAGRQRSPPRQRTLETQKSRADWSARRLRRWPNSTISGGRRRSR